MMKVALLGYGKMGKEIERILLDRNHEVKLIVSSQNYPQLTSAQLKRCDMAIDFTAPHIAPILIERCFTENIPVVSGTTGLGTTLEELKTQCLAHNQGFFWSPNFSLGVNLFFKLNTYLAQLMATYPQYQAAIEETHHVHKKDAPSGTALYIANDIVNNNPHYNPHQPIISHRLKDEIGKHQVKYTSSLDEIEIMHTSKSRFGFAFGAVIAAEWLVGKKGNFNMDNLLKA